MMFAFLNRFARMMPVAAALALSSISAGAQQTSAVTGPPKAPPNALQGFSQNRDQPIKIDSDSLEVRDKEKVATFSGNVQLVQGDTTLKCKSLVVFYNTDAKTAASSPGSSAPGSSVAATSAAASKDSGQQNIRRIEVHGNVVVTQKDQKATADNGFFDMKTNTITLVGNVVISQGQNVVRGDRLSVDLTTSVSRVECEKTSNCRVQALLQPSGKEGGPEIGGTRDLMKLNKPSGPGL